MTIDSVLGKSGENRGTLEYSQMNVFIVVIENYIFLERGRSYLSKNVLYSMGTKTTFM